MQGHADRAFAHVKALADLGRAFAFDADRAHDGGRTRIQLRDQDRAVPGRRHILRRSEREAGEEGGRLW